MKILILTPIRVEYDEVRKYLSTSSIVNLQHEGITYEKGLFEGKYHKCEVIIKETGSKNNDIALATEKAIQSFNPEIVILTGIAGGVKDVKIGDVVIANKMYGYESGKETENGFLARPEAIYCSPDLYSFAQNISRSDEWKSRSSYAETSSVFHGPIASGGKVIASTDSVVYERLKKYFNDTIALEMEAIGFGKAMLHYPLIKFINIRGISDLLNDKSKTDSEGSQQVAISNAVAFVFETIYNLDYSKLNVPKEIGDLKTLVKDLYKEIEPLIQKNAGSDVDVQYNPYLSTILEKIKPFLFAEYEEMIADIQDADNHAVFRNRLKKILIGNEEIASSLKMLLEQSENPQPIINLAIDSRKSIIDGSAISVTGGDFHQGDKTTIVETQINNPIHIGDIINVNQVLSNSSNEKPDKESSLKIEEVHDLVSKNKIKPALELLLSATKNADADLHRQVILLTNRWNRLMNEFHSGVISKSQKDVEMNRIINALVNLVEEI